MEEKNSVGAPSKPEDERQVTFTVNCKKKNLEVIKPLAKSYVKELDKKDWSKVTNQ